MSFLAPMFLVGALAVGLPVIFHLIRRSTKDRKVFSSLIFLSPSPPRLSRRSRLEHLLLLLLRCVAIVLLATGFARPFLKHAQPEIPKSGVARRTLVLLDTSASMRRQGLWDRAVNKAKSVLSETSPIDQAALFTFDREFKSLMTFEQWRANSPGERVALARGKLDAIQPSWAGTALDTALIQAADILGETDKDVVGGLKQVVVITDLQEGSQTRALQGHDWPKGVEVVLERVNPASANNAGIQLVAESTDADYLAEATVRVRVINAADAKREQFEVGWAAADGNFIVKPTAVYVPPNQSRVLAIPAPPTNAITDRIVLRGDDEPFDNTVYVLPPQRTRTTILYLGNESPGESRQPLYFLQRAFQQTRSQTIQVAAQKTSAPLTKASLDTAGLIVVTDVLGDGQLGALRQAVTHGSTLLLSPTSAAAFSGLGKILGLPEMRVEDQQLSGYAMLGEVDFRHPLFSAFGDARFSDFTKIHFWKYRKFDAAAVPGASVVARFDTGDPAVLQVPLEKGRIIVLASCWLPSDSQLALSSKFVPLLYSLLDLGGAALPAPQQYFVGDRVNLTAETVEVGAKADVRLPDGTTAHLKAGDTNFSQTAMPGIYSLPNATPPKRFAVNLDAVESRTAPMPADELERLSVPTAHPTPLASTQAERIARLQNAELEARQKLWRWFIIATLGVLGLETWLAGRTARRGAIQEAPAL